MTDLVVITPKVTAAIERLNKANGALAILTSNAFNELQTSAEVAAISLHKFSLVSRKHIVPQLPKEVHKPYYRRERW